MNMYRILFLLLFFYSGATFSQEPISLSLQQAKQRALASNVQLKNAALEIDAAHNSLRATQAKGLPQVEAGFDYTHFFDYEIDFSFGSSGAGAPDIDFSLLDAGDIQILNFLQSSFGSQEPIVMKGSSTSRIQVSQLLFSGQYWVGIQTAKLAKLISEQQLEKNKTEILESVSNVYFGILVLEESLEILSSTSENLQETFRKTAALVRAGIAEDTDTLQLRMAQNALTNNRKLIERSLEFNYTMLKFLLGIPFSSPLVLSDSPQTFLLEDDILARLSQSFRVEDNIDYQIMQSQVDISSSLVRLQKASYLPTVAGFYAYNHKFVTTGIDMNPDHMLGVSVQIPIFSSGHRHFSVQEAKIRAVQTEQAQQLVSEQLKMHAQQAQFNLRNAYENYILQKENIALAQLIYERTRIKYEYGVASSFDVTQTNNAFLEAQSNYVQAYMQVFQAKNALDALTQSLY